MDYRYMDPSRSPSYSYEQPSYQQPATQSVIHTNDSGYGYSVPTDTGMSQDYQYSTEYQDLGEQDQYDNQAYAEETAWEPSLSDYNSHESCVKITTRK